MYWTVGEYLNPQPEELERPFQVQDVAQQEAKRFSNLHKGTAFGVWDHRCNIVCIWIDGLRFNAE
jgi:hypothetical protein